MTQSEHVPKLFQHAGFRFALISMLVVLGLFLYLGQDESGVGIDHAARHIQETIESAEREHALALPELTSLSEFELFEHFNLCQEDYDSKGLSYFIFENDELLAWSTNTVPEAERLPELIASGPCVLLDNGWYLIDEFKKNGRVAYGLFLVKYEYLYENKYLVNRFHKSFHLHHNPDIQFTSEDGALPILNADKDVIFYLQGSQDSSSSLLRTCVTLLLIGLSIFLILRYLFDRIYRWKSSIWGFLISSAVVLGLRLLQVMAGWPESMTSMDLFQIEVLAESLWHPSLADLLINSFIFLMLSYSYKEWVRKSEGGSDLLHILSLSAHFLFLCRWMDELISGVVHSTLVGFNISNFFDLELSSVLAVVAIVLLLISILFLAQTLVFLIRFRQRDVKARYLLFFLSLGGLILVNHWMGVVDMVKVLWPWIVLAYLILAQPMRSGGPRLVYLLGIMAILSFYSSYTIEKQFVKRDRNKLQVIADRLMEGADPVAEYLFDDVRESLEADSVLWEIATKVPLDKERVLSQLRKDYFSGYWTKYNLDIRTSTGKQTPEYRFVKETPGIGFYRAPDSELGLNYILAARPDSSSLVVYVEFQLNIIPEELGFPELLIEGNSLIGDQLTHYSFAQYVEGELVNFYGDFDYKLRQPDLAISSSGYFQAEDYWHYPFTRGSDTYIISTPSKSFINRLTTFTFLFGFMGLMITLAFLIERILISRELPRADLQNKIQFLVVSILFSSLLVFGIGAYYYIISQNRVNNESQLTEKVSSVLIELSHKLEKEQAFGDKEKLELYLDKFSKVFFTDINLYSLEGHLLASSRPEVFNRGLISEQMDSYAYQRLALEHESRFIHKERIGGLEYLSAYVPFMDSKKEVLAYLNLPYFARQGELEDELSRFLVAVVNILVLLFVLSILVAVLVSNWITRPLQLLKENLAAIRLDKRNQPIEYQGSDEIASLVTEYNAKVDELQRNAELLAKSERESAWREMAKQVAHEIKNPLTPMKLSIQYLQRSQSDKGPDWDERFQRSTTMLIEQIDTLSSIASAFSDFAQMPKATNEYFDFKALVEQVADLFAEEPDAELEVHMKIEGTAEVFADRDQISRVLTNLIKNAIQSIPEDREGKIEIELMSKGHQYILEVRDNGTGVPEEMKEKIFVPNFTTKTTGTGLGLAMSKNIVELAGGQIWFTTVEGKGSSFFVSIPQPAKSDSAQS